MNKRFSYFLSWSDDRLGLSDFFSNILQERIRGGAHWALILPAGLLFLFILQILTGLLLAAYYVPAADHAHTTVAWIQKEVAGGSFIRGLHYWASAAMIVLLAFYLIQLFARRAYRNPRQMIWIIAILIGVPLIFSAFTGSLLRWDQDGFFSTRIVAEEASRIPLLGSWFTAIFIGGTHLSTITLSRFYWLHTMVLPLFTAVLFDLLRRAYRRARRLETADARPGLVEAFYPRQFLYNSVFVFLLFAILAILSVRRPPLLGTVANPGDSQFLARPFWLFLPMFQLQKTFSGSFGSLLGAVVPLILFALLLLVPFIDPRQGASWLKGGVAPAMLIAGFAAFGGLIFLSMRDDGAFLAASDIDRLQKISTDQLDKLSPLDRRLWNAAENRSKLEEQSAFAAEYAQAPFEPDRVGGMTVIRQNLPPVPQQFAACAECHGDLGGGGLIGPDLIDVGKKYRSAENLESVLLEPQAHGIGGGQMHQFTDDKMPAAERKALIEYLIGLSRK